MNAWRTGSGIWLSGTTVRRSNPYSAMSRPSAAYTFDVWVCPPPCSGKSREMLGQRSAAQTRVHEPYANPAPYVAASRAKARIRRRVVGSCHQRAGLGSGRGVVSVAIGLQPSQAAACLPA